MAKSKGNHDRVDISNERVKKMTDLKDVLQEYIGSHVAVLCARFNYMGILSSVGQGYLILAQAHAVEESGPSNNDAPVTADNIGSSIIISFAAVEIVFQPNWVFSLLKE